MATQAAGTGRPATIHDIAALCGVAASTVSRALSTPERVNIRTRERIQVFEGICIKRQGSGFRETFTVRKQSFGVGVERTFPLHSPKIERLEVMAIGDVRRAKLYYLRKRVGKKARVRELRQS